MNILVTGGAGFIGSSLIDVLLMNKDNYIISVDNYDSFYSKSIKQSNQKKHFENRNFEFHEIDIKNIKNLKTLKKIDCIIHLAAKAGVRPSIENAPDFFDVNIYGTLAVLEYAKDNNIKQFIFASSSSVYGINPNIPWSEDELNLLPISPYASSKLACEKIGFTYSYLYQIRFISLRFFTVFGPRQRPDLAISKFFNSLQKNTPIEMFGNGSSIRDYTFIDDIVQGIINSISYNATSYEIINLGNSHAISLKELVNEIAKVSNITPNIIYKNEQLGDVPKTYANIKKGYELLNYKPKTLLKEGLRKQYEWLKTTNYDSKNNS